MKIRPLYDRIVVKRIEEKEQMQGGLYIPDTAKEKPQEGEVVAVGKGKRLEDGKVVALDVQVGDRILFGKYSGSDIKLDGEEYLIMREDEVLGILDAKPVAAMVVSEGIRQRAVGNSRGTQRCTSILKATVTRARVPRTSLNGDASWHSSHSTLFRILLASGCSAAIVRCRRARRLP